ncbi:hypothetical protein HHL11_33205 [Ramlibacter sp. G-1-2-2]|uniref:J domain-containing protein n=1 Tax=Ramlibacter agri TaxID=2728837 RepID=A0A848HH40_9BURK|nr:hypothetical protein [Ramlibacter agri]NML48641.1 hypothetical protein [Ramlibacter agri]
MSDAGALFARLQLRPDATVQDVRRAYARELKRIDQATQAEAFQELRETYERLLGWLQSQEREASVAQPVAQEAAVPQQSAAPQPAPSAEDSGAQVLNLLLECLQQPPPLASNDEAEDLLAHCLRDERLSSLDARQYFEWGVASLLANGWRPGHERLFVPAVEAFGWQDDRSRLLWLGHPGRVLDQAIDELATFDLQEFAVRGTQRDVLRALRADARPATSDLLAWLPLGTQLAGAFPAWLHVVTRPQQLEAWKRWDADVPNWRRWLHGRRRRHKRPVNMPMLKRASWSFGAVWFIAVAVGILAKLSEPRSSPTPPVREVPSSSRLAPPALRDPAPANYRLLPDGRAPANREPDGLGLKREPMKLGPP